MDSKIEDFLTLKPRLLKLDTPQLCDASAKVKLLDISIKSINLGLKMSGVAYTIDTPGDLLAVIKGISESVANEVLVINSNLSKQALFGELFTNEALRKKLSGVVIDGACRDVEAIKTTPLPVFAKWICAQAGSKNHLGKTQVPITCGGLIITPGDIIVGDDNGIVVIDPNDLPEILASAEAIRNKEITILQEIKNGKSLIDLL